MKFRALMLGLFSVPVLAIAGSFTVPIDTTALVEGPVISQSRVADIVQWGATNGFSTNVVAGTLVRFYSVPYVAQASGTTAVPLSQTSTTLVPYVVMLGQRIVGTNITTNVTSVVTNMPSTGASVIVDGTVKWLRCPTGTRNGFAIQWVSGGSASVYFGLNGPISLSSSLPAVSVGADYQGVVSVTAVGDNSVINTIDW